MPQHRKRIAPPRKPIEEIRRPESRSRATNGRQLFFAGTDGRSAWVRRCRDLIGLHIADLGGYDNTSEAERSIVRRAAVLTTELEILENRFAKSGAGADAEQLDLYQRTAGNLRRLFEATGIRRRPRDITPSLEQYLESKSREADDAELVEAETITENKE
jgi:hypothetical protein